MNKEVVTKIKEDYPNVCIDFILPYVEDMLECVQLHIGDFAENAEEDFIEEYYYNNSTR